MFITLLKIRICLEKSKFENYFTKKLKLKQFHKLILLKSYIIIYYI